ncbi:hypothetical protein P5X88_02745 [Heyndrickxia oleronia]|uniref:Uncharacterized protein n=1 Tax=Heyndrickxia oleronia TaxID=38875 RepID=A0AAW6SM56_9BACI|nr:hypothetical protein [Heyndrickxia oleronia]
MNEFYYCYSPNLQAFLQTQGQRFICVGLNEKTLRKFWQYKRSAELDELLTKWQAQKPA